MFVESLSAEQIREIEERMRDPRFSASLFLGGDESLVDRVRSDAATLGNLGLTHDQIADSLEAVVGKTHELLEAKYRTLEYRVRQDARMLRAAHGDPSQIMDETLEDDAVLVDGYLLVFPTAYMGFQFCPFEYSLSDLAIHSCGRASWDYEVRNQRNGSHLLVSELMVHLIRCHHFFEGEGCPYRLDPRRVAEVLELAPGTTCE